MISADRVNLAATLFESPPQNQCYSLPPFVRLLSLSVHKGYKLVCPHLSRALTSATVPHSSEPSAGLNMLPRYSPCGIPRQPTVKRKVRSNFGNHIDADSPDPKNIWLDSQSSKISTGSHTLLGISGSSHKHNKTFDSLDSQFLDSDSTVQEVSSSVIQHESSELDCSLLPGSYNCSVPL